MMQLSRELKTLAREFSLAVVVSVAGLCPSCAGVWRGAVGTLWSLWERGPHSQLSLNPTVPCSLTSLQPADVLFQAWGKTWADVLPPALAVLSQHGIHWIEQGRVKYRQMERLVVFIFDRTPFI